MNLENLVLGQIQINPHDSTSYLDQVWMQQIRVESGLDLVKFELI